MKVVLVCTVENEIELPDVMFYCEDNTDGSKWHLKEEYENMILGRHYNTDVVAINDLDGDVIAEW